MPAFNLSDLEAEADEVQGQPGLLNKLQDSQGYTEGRKEKKKWNQESSSANLIHGHSFPEYLPTVYSEKIHPNWLHSLVSLSGR